jgi:hypothetical protein
MNLAVIPMFAGVVVVSVMAGAAQQRGGDFSTAVPVRVSVKDPCEVATAAQLKTVLAVALGKYFPIHENKDGEKVTVSEPTITEAKCPGFRIEVKLSMRYQKTRGFPQFSASGTAKFASGVDLRITHPMYIGAGSPIPAGDVKGAKVCMTNITVTDLNINNVPNWLDNSWLRGQLQEFLQNKCEDVTDLVRLYIQQGGVVKAS